MSTCATCWYSETGTHGNIFDCRRHAPILIDGVGTRWPGVLISDWCGDYAATPKEADRGPR